MAALSPHSVPHTVPGRGLHLPLHTHSIQDGALCLDGVAMQTVSLHCTKSVISGMELSLRLEKPF